MPLHSIGFRSKIKLYIVFARPTGISKEFGTLQLLHVFTLELRLKKKFVPLSFWRVFDRKTGVFVNINVIRRDIEISHHDIRRLLHWLDDIISIERQKSVLQLHCILIILFYCNTSMCDIICGNVDSLILLLRASFVIINYRFRSRSVASLSKTGRATKTNGKILRFFFFFLKSLPGDALSFARTVGLSDRHRR